MKFIVDKKIFDSFLNLRLVVTHATINNPNNHVKEINDYLNESWLSSSNIIKEYDNPQSHPYIKAWGDAMRNVGVNRNKFPSSIEALVRRASKSPTPPNINVFVDFYNALSLKHFVPIGGFDLDSISKDIELRFSTNNDTFKALDSDTILQLDAGEIVYADKTNIITRHFVWKQSTHAIMSASTKKIFFVSEILGVLDDEKAHEVANAFKDGIKQYFDTDCNVVIMDKNNPIYEF